MIIISDSQIANLDINTDDKVLVKEFCESSNFDAFGIIYEKYAKLVYKSIYIKVGDRESAEDILSQTFEILLDVLPKFRFESNLKTYITGIAFNKVRQHWQKSSNEGLSLDERLIADKVEDEDSDTTEQELFEKDLITAILNDLEHPYDDVLELRFLKGHSINQTAQILELSSANVRVIQHRAIKKASEIASQLISKKANE